MDQNVFFQCMGLHVVLKLLVAVEATSFGVMGCWMLNYSSIFHHNGVLAAGE